MKTVALPPGSEEALAALDLAAARRTFEAAGEPPQGKLPEGSPLERLAAELWRAVFSPAEKLAKVARRARDHALPDERAATALAHALVRWDLPWPHRDAAALADDEVQAWLRVLDRAPDLDPASFELVRLAFRVRPREQWLPAARLLGRAAARGPGRARDELTATAAWVRAGDDAGRSAHERRHALVALAAWLAAGPESARAAGADEPLLLESPLPRDPADLSARARAVAELAGVEAHAAGVERFVAKVLAKDRPEPQLAEALVALVERVPGSGAHAWLARLARRPGDALTRALATRWVGARLVCARALARLAPGSLSALLDEEPELRPLTALAVAPGGPATREAWPFLRHDPVREPSARRAAWVAATTGRLARLAEPGAWRLVDPLARAATIEELVALLDLEDARDVPWDALARAAGWPPARVVTGPAGEVCRPELILALDELEGEAAQFPEHLVRGQRLDLDRCHALAARQHGFLDIQIAIGIEALLRRGATLGDDGARLRTLARLLQRRPSTKLFDQLADVARDPGLVALARAARAYCAGRPGSRDDYFALLAALGAAVPAAAATLAELEALGRAIDELPGAPLAVALDRLTAIVHAGATTPGDLAGLLLWVEGRTASTEELGRELLARASALRERSRAVACADLDDLAAWLAALAEGLAGLSGAADRRLPEPQARLFDVALEAVRARVLALGEELARFRAATAGAGIDALGPSGAARAALVAALRDERFGAGVSRVEEATLDATRALADRAIDAALDEGDEVTVLGLLARAQSSELFASASEPRLLALKAWLLDRYLFGAVLQLDQDESFKRRAIAGAVWSHYLPLWCGVPVGALQLVQMLEAMADVIDKRPAAVVAGSAGALVLATLGYLLWELRDRPVSWASAGFFTRPGAAPVAPVSGRFARWGVAVRRVGPLFAIALLESFACAAIGYALISGTDVTRAEKTAGGLALLLLAWTAITLFVGVFVGLIAAGRKIGGT